ncbi:hypothetical protein [Oleiagrimonas sp. C23AA]|uniref:hypothetical protein n=1 Tax=Oleiagrimonas sp. C23AA TaxID=2719047 RepID=UPI001422CBB6|nr:hypothetical protein [Oleiagrimonas sp. C23AA]NII11195.1 hypothetical protein [Oleiagrimonas sp. C23AA]
MSTRALKRCIAATVAALLLATAGLPAMAGPSGAQAPASASSSVTPASQAAFNKNMQIMRGQMMQLRAAHDPAARSKLLDAHMRTMQSTLHMMMGQGGKRGSGGMGPGMMGGGMSGSGGMMANGRMMQMMMGQMMQHQKAMQAMGCTQ